MNLRAALTALIFSLGLQVASAAPYLPGLIDTEDEKVAPKFKNPVPDALSPNFRFKVKKKRTVIGLGRNEDHMTGLEDGYGNKLKTTIHGYGQDGEYTWPGKTLEVESHVPLRVLWKNELDPHKVDDYPMTDLVDDRTVVDETIHWAYSLHGLQGSSIKYDGIPMVVHLHGGNTRFQFDGYPESFFTYLFKITGPEFQSKWYKYDNSQTATALWTHDHALGLTRLNVYAGTASFYFIRDDIDTGRPGNKLNLPVWPYEKAYAIQDRFFKEDGQLFYPAYYYNTSAGEEPPYWNDFLVDTVYANGEEPSVMAEFFGDTIVVNGVIWPFEEVEPRKYRLRLLNGCDSRFLVIEFKIDGTGEAIPFNIIGSDQGFGQYPRCVTKVVMGPADRADVIFNFKHFAGKRIIITNTGGDEPFGGIDPDMPGPQLYPNTNEIMAFDVKTYKNHKYADPPINRYWPQKKALGYPDRVRRVGLFEGLDPDGRLQPLLGGILKGTTFMRTYVWDEDASETPKLGDTEIWEIYNWSADAHPVHLHLVEFEVLDRYAIMWDSNTTDPNPEIGVEEDRVLGSLDDAAGNGAYLLEIVQLQHDGEPGLGFRVGGLDMAYDPKTDMPLDPDSEELKVYALASGPNKDMVTALPGQVTRIKVEFNRPGLYVWHCHVLSHEDHEMMRDMPVMEKHYY